jgi:dethiobiotin synthetase
LRGVFVTGTDTGVGKTVVAASIVTTLRARGEPVRAFKPVVTGTDEPDPVWPADHELLARAAGLEVRCVVMTPWPDEPDAMQRSNRATVEQLGAVSVHGLPQTTPDRLPSQLAWV